MESNSVRTSEYEIETDFDCGNVNVLHFQRHDMDKVKKEKGPRDFILGFMVNKLRVEKGMTFEMVEEILGLPKAFTHNLTTGSGPQCTSRIVDIADYFGVSCDFLLRGEDKNREQMEKEIQELYEKTKKLEAENSMQKLNLDFFQHILDEQRKNKENVYEINQSEKI